MADTGSDKLVFDSQPADGGQKFGRELLVKVALCLKQATVHQLGNAAMKAPIGALLAHVSPSLQRGEALALQTLGESYFLNHDLLKLDFQSFEAGQSLRGIFKRLGIQELAFTGAVDEADLREFLATFQTFYRSNEPKKIIGAANKKIRLRALGKTGSGSGQGDSFDERQNVLRTYAVMAVTVQEALEELKLGRPPRLSRLRKAIHRLADATVGHEQLLVGITRFPGMGGELKYHLTTVVALVLLMARRLGLDRVALSDACLAALLHDAARTDLIDEDEVGAAKKRAQDALRVPLTTMLRLCGGGIGPELLGMAAVAGEVPMRESGGPDKPGPLARLISVACAYDLLTAPKPPRRGMLPDQALRTILDRAPGRFDPRIAKLFATTVGLYPVGTTVQLSTGETALVLEVPDDPAHFSKPRVKVVRNAGGAADYLLDLADPACRAEIVHSVDPVEAQIEVPQLLLA